MARRPFDLEHGPLIRASVVRLDETDHALVIVMHHAVTDGWSLDILRGACSERQHPWPRAGAAMNFAAPSLQYVDFARWQRRCLQGDVQEKELIYWRKKLVLMPRALELLVANRLAIGSNNLQTRKAARCAMRLARTTPRRNRQAGPG